jgi:hypothetical protein
VHAAGKGGAQGGVPVRERGWAAGAACAAAGGGKKRATKVGVEWGSFAGNKDMAMHAKRDGDVCGVCRSAVLGGHSFLLLNHA